MKIPSKPLTFKEITEKMSDPGLLRRIAEIPEQQAGPAPQGQYRHWDTFRRIQPPAGLTPQEWWVAVKWARLQTRRFIPLADCAGRRFFYTMPDPALEMLHTIDQGASGRIAMPDSIVNPQTKDRYLQSSLIEEAITSSQLEGAATTRKVAKEMLRSGRTPADLSERMILNNYRAMQFIGECRERKMTPAMIKEIHGTIAEDTLPADTSPPWLRQDNKIAVWDDRENTLLHQPPDAGEIPARMKGLCQFANGSPRDRFVHPVVRAILLHFWLAYDHPFIDGNGRTARALFYWAMLKRGYWLAEFLSISSILHKRPAAYGRSFLYTETDEGDLTYFILDQLRIVCRSIEELHGYLARKTGEIRAIEQMLRATAALNHRQVALLGHAMRNPGSRYSIQLHRHSHGVTYQTARNDLLVLEKTGLLVRSRAGRAFSFAAQPGLEQRLRESRKDMEIPENETKEAM